MREKNIKKLARLLRLLPDERDIMFANNTDEEIQRMLEQAENLAITRPQDEDFVGDSSAPLQDLSPTGHEPTKIESNKKS